MHLKMYLVLLVSETRLVRICECKEAKPEIINLRNIQKPQFLPFESIFFCVYFPKIEQPCIIHSMGTHPEIVRKDCPKEPPAVFCIVVIDYL